MLCFSKLLEEGHLCIVCNVFYVFILGGMYFVLSMHVSSAMCSIAVDPSCPAGVRYEFKDE